jgi:hypothetical protein
MKASGSTPVAILCRAGGRRFWRWPLAFALALAVAVSLFHDLPALAGWADSSPIPVAVATSATTPMQSPDTQAPGHGCHCLCHITAQSAVSLVVTPIVFTDSLCPPRNGAPTRSWAGLPPFRPPRV